MRKLLFLAPVFAVILVVVIVAYTHSQNTPVKDIRIVSIENVYGNIASQIGGPYVQVESILSNPNTDPHAYDPTVQDATNIGTAKLVIMNGAGYDSFADKLLTASSNQDREVINAAAVVGVSDAQNPHIWYSLAYIQAVAAKVTQDLANIDPAHKGAYEQHDVSFVQSLHQDISVCNQIKTGFAMTKVIATERVADYLLAGCGLNIIPNGFQKAIEEGNDPSSADVIFFQNTLQQHEAKLLIYNTQTVNSFTAKMQQTASENGIPVVGVSETLPFQKNYQEWILDELLQIYDNLK